MSKINAVSDAILDAMLEQVREPDIGGAGDVRDLAMAYALLNGNAASADVLRPVIAEALAQHGFRA